MSKCEYSHEDHCILPIIRPKTKRCSFAKQTGKCKSILECTATDNDLMTEEEYKEYLDGEKVVSE